MATSVSGSGTVSRAPEAAGYSSGDSVTLTATPSNGYTFSGWSGDLTGTNNPATITVNSNKTITANFVQLYSLSVNVVGNGTVTKSPDAIGYAPGTAVTLTATPATGYLFSGWGGDASGSANTATITVNSNKTVTATFVRTFALRVNTVGLGSVTKSPDARGYAAGTTVTLTATPGTSCAFAGWNGNLSGSDNPATIVVDSDKTITASFVSQSPSNYSFPAYTHVPEGFSNQAYLDTPQLTLRNDWAGVARSVTKGYIAFREGPNHPSQITDDAITASLTRVNSDLKHLVEQLGVRLPPYTQSPTSQYMNWYLLGSGLPGDNTSLTNPPETGYQGWRLQPNGTWLPDVEMTYHNFTATPDEYHRWAITHEFGHVLQGGYGALTNDQAGWFNEAHNDYLMAYLRKDLTGVQTVGWITPYALMASYLPIESWGPHSDGEASGPGGLLADDRTYFSNSNTGYASYRYSLLFPLFLSQRTARFFTNALWEQATPTETVIQATTRLLGTSQTQQLLTEYAARNALLDYEGFSADLRATLNSAFARVGTSNWMYTATTQDQSGWLTPSDPIRLPRYTGRNNVPIKVESGATQVSVEFAPDATGSKGTPSTMTAQLVYRAADGTAVFSTPVSSGTTTVNFTPAPAGGNVILVITNATLSGFQHPSSIYGWDVSERYGYKFRILAGGTSAPVTGTEKYY